MQGNNLKKWRPAVLIGVLTTLVLTVFFVSGVPGDAQSAMEKGDYQRAAQLYGMRAREGDPIAQNALGSLYYLGLGVPRDYVLSSKWFLAAAFQKNADAQVNIARQYQMGYGVKRDELRAFGWFRQARLNKSEIAESYMKWIAGGMILGPLQMQRSLEIYKDLDDLIPSAERGGL